MEQHIIMPVGYQGSGKTTFAHKNYSNYIILDGDSLKTSSKVTKALKANLKTNKSVFVDATNMSIKRRNPIMKLAEERKIKVICIWFRDDLDVCLERVKKRFDEGGKKIPPVALYTTRKYYTEPTLEEGFSKIISIENFEVIF